MPLMNAAFRLLASAAVAILAMLVAVSVWRPSAERDADRSGVLSGGPPASTAVTPVAWIPRVAPSWTPRPPTPPTPLDVRLCDPTDLNVFAQWDAAASHLYTTMLLANRSATACQLSGAPHVDAVDANGITRVRSVPPPNRDAIPPVLLQPGRQLPNARSWNEAGLAVLMVEWSTWCGAPIVVRTYRIDLPTGALIVAVPKTTGTSADVTVEQRCLASGLPRSPSLIVGAFFATLVPETPPPLILSARIDAPATVNNDATLRYTVTLTNETAATYTFGTCPIYDEQFVKNARRYYLNCDSVAPLPPGASVTFEMRLDLDPRLTPAREQWDLRWALEPRPNSATASARLRATDPASVITPTPAPKAVP
jgi:hypothetical protein